MIRWMLAVLLLSAHGVQADTPEIIVAGSSDQVIELFEDAGYWGDVPAEGDIPVPPVLIVALDDQWEVEANNLPVETKKALFYRALLPLILLSNEEIEITRETLERLIEEGDTEELTALARRYGVLTDDAEWPAEPSDLLIDLRERIDTVPPSLAIAQAAYESGYGTSRFAREGQALFGQWVYGGEGIEPDEKRAEKGDYGIASFDWLLDAVRAYMQNLNTHSAYAEFRRVRAAARKQGRTAGGAELARTLTRYSERGQAYVETLLEILEFNELAAADRGRLTGGPVTLVVGAPSEAEVAQIESEIDALRASGELDRLVRELGVPERR